MIIIITIIINIIVWIYDVGLTYMKSFMPWAYGKRVKIIIVQQKNLPH